MTGRRRALRPWDRTTRCVLWYQVIAICPKPCSKTLGGVHLGPWTMQPSACFVYHRRRIHSMCMIWKQAELIFTIRAFAINPEPST